ncbi:MAG: deoxyribodipyrimidine photo-lyase [Pseudomonadota bacterium]
MASYKKTLFWFRRDLRDYDNAGLAAALANSDQVYCVFVFDREILDALPKKHDRRVDFIHRSVLELDTALRKLGGYLIMRHNGTSVEIPALAKELHVDAVFTNHDYEPLAVQRDSQVAAQLKKTGVAFYTFKDQSIFEKREVLTQSGKPFSVFTPYKNAWLKRLTDEDLAPHDVEIYRDRFAADTQKTHAPTLAEIGFEPTNIHTLLPAGTSGAKQLFTDFRSHIAEYKEARNFPAVRGVSYLSIHQRFGTISIRELVRIARAEQNVGADTWLSELIWREFYFQILHHYPHVVSAAFKSEYDKLRWENDENLFKAWCEARTGYPIVDAAMRQINETGYMHNRLRMIAGSFLTKDLLIDWRWGEKYFADNLNDFDLAANNGGWQWVASTGCDAQPYFRIFNPVTQSEKFDPHGKFIRKYLPELTQVPDRYIHTPWMMSPQQQQAANIAIGRDYPQPIVDHAVQRQKVLEMYTAVK